LISKRTFLITLAFIALLAAIGAPAKKITLSIIYNTYTSPYNMGWNGTSIYVSKLIELGYNVKIVNSRSELKEYTGSKVLYIAIAPEEPYTSDDILILREMMRNGALRMIYADENHKTANTILYPLFKARIAKGYLSYPNDPSRPIIGYNVKFTFMDGKRYSIRLNIASAIEEPGELNPTCYVKLPIALEGHVITRDDGWPLMGYWSLGDDKAFIIADSSLFINMYFEYPELSDNDEFIISLSISLTENDTSYTILIDNYHYNVHKRINELSEQVLSRFTLPLLPIGLIVGFIMARIFNMVDESFLTMILFNNVFKILILVAVMLILYSYISKRLGTSGFDEKVYTYEEIYVLGETSIKSRLLKVSPISKKEFKLALSTLYEVLNDLIYKYVGVRLADVKKESLEYKKLKAIIGDDLDRYWSSIVKLRRIYENVKYGKTLFPPIVMWRKTFNKLINVCEVIVERFGASIIDKEGLRGVEYKLRKR